MLAFLGPGIGFFRKFRYPYKFGIIFLVFMFPLLILAHSQIQSINKSIALLENESQGLEYLAVVRQPVEYIQQHRGMTAAYHNGADEFYQRIMDKRVEVDAAIAELVDVDKKIGSSLKTGKSVEEIKTTWENIKQVAFGQTAKETVRDHTQLVHTLFNLMKLVSANSEIPLDPVLDSFYLGSALRTDLPLMIESMGLARAGSSSIAAKKAFTQKSFINLSVLSSEIDSLSKKMEDELKSAVDYNEDVAKALKGAIESNTESVKLMKKMLHDDLLEVETITIDSSETWEIATNAINTSYALFDLIVPALNGLFQQRLASNKLNRNVTVFGVFFVLVLVVYSFASLYFSLIRNINRVAYGVESIEEGKLSTRLKIETNDEMKLISDDFNSMAERFESLVKEIADAVKLLSMTAIEYSQVSVDSHQSIENQNRETEQVATAMNEMSATVQEVAKSASDASISASNADNEAASGKSIVQETIGSIEGIAGEVENAGNVIQSLAKESEQIGSVLDVIKGIAEQTNLLALNAAIEAARAGEQGRGFAVVADEVRTLASRTQDSTKEIEAMIERLQIGANNAVQVMDTGHKKAQEGVNNGHRAASALLAITDAVDKINQMNSHIACAAEEQSVTADEMNKNIIHISQMADITLEGAKETREKSTKLSELANNLDALLGQFKLSA